MKIGYNEATGRGCSTLEQDLLLCEQAGFDYIEIRLDMLRAYLERHALDELKGFFASARIKPHALNAIYLSEGLFSGPAEERDAFLAEFRSACAMASELGAGHLIVVPPLSPDRKTPWPTPWDQARPDCAESLRRLGGLAQRDGVRLCFELVGAPWSAVRSVAEARAVVEDAALPNVGYVFDAYNLYLNGRLSDFSALDGVEPEKVFAVHLNDGRALPQDELGQDKRLFCGEGDVDLGAFLGRLKALGFQGMASIETFRPEYWAKPAEWVVETAYRTTRDTLEKYGCL